MWTETPSPIGPLRIVEHHGAITAIEFSPWADGDGRPRGEKQDDLPVLVEAVRQLAAYFDGTLTEEADSTDFLAAWAGFFSIEVRPLVGFFSPSD